MPYQDTIAKIEREMAEGELGRARDRLQGLLVTYPDNLDLRRRLGEVFWKLQYPELAGRYWYLLPSECEEMDKAKAAFERRFKSSATLMLYELHYRGGMEAVQGTHAEEVLRELARRAHMTRRQLETIVRLRQPGERKMPDPGWGWQSWLVGAFLLVLVALMIIGLVTAVGWVI